jgi:hypothetical protein
VALQRMRRKPVPVILAISLFAFFVLGLAPPASAPPPPNECNSGTRNIERQWNGVWFKCICSGTGAKYRCKWRYMPAVAGNQRGKNTEFEHAATNSVALISSAIVHHVGGYGNFGDATIQIYGTSGNPLNRTIGIRIIVGRWTGSSWVACHDSNWHYAPTQRSVWSIRQPANCGGGYYRAQSAGTYFSNSLGTYITTGWVITESLCISSGPCNQRSAPPDIRSTA